MVDRFRLVAIETQNMAAGCYIEEATWNLLIFTSDINNTRTVFFLRIYSLSQFGLRHLD